MFPIKGFHFWSDEDVSISQYNKIAQNQRNYSSLLGTPIPWSSELVRMEKIFLTKSISKLDSKWTVEWDDILSVFSQV